MPLPLPPSIALFGIFGADNYGNEGSLVTMLRYLKAAFPQARLSAICTHPERVTTDYGIPAVPIRVIMHHRRAASFIVRALHRLVVRFPREIRTWIRTIAYMRKVDVLMIPGTGILDDYAVTPGDLPYSLFRWCVSARLAGSKVLFVSIGAGPITHPASRWFMRTAARLATYRSFRDQLSKDYMASLGLDTQHDGVYPDLTFHLPVPGTQRDPKDGDVPSVIGVGLMTYYGWGNDPIRGAEVLSTYVRKITDFVVWLLRNGYSVRLLIGERGDAQTADLVMGEVLNVMGTVDGTRLVSASVNSVDAVLSEIAATDLLIATRYHNVVYSILLDKPVISIGYAPRNAALLSDIGLGKYCHHIENFDLTALIQQFSEVRDNRHILKKCITQKRQEYQRALQEQFDGPLARLLTTSRGMSR